MKAMNSTAMWSSVVLRDAAADGRFVYGVRSTGVYCRPSCPGRTPLRENVLFFPRPADAERAGFRACRRCGGVPGPSASSVVSKACAAIDAAPDHKPRLASLADAAGVSPRRLQQLFHDVLGLSPLEYAEARRTGRLKGLLQRQPRVVDALYEAGYGSSSRLYERADAELGMTPAAYRSGGAGMQIHFVVVPSALGRLLVAATERGVCSVKIGDSARALEDDLRREYPNAAIERSLGPLSPAVSAIQAIAAGERPPVNLPLDIQGTAFQRRVWAHLQGIPFGRTRSYAAVAQAIGQPTAVRAVANACGANPVALLVPCHRVVASDGSLGGYHWGVQRKARLQALEQEHAPAAARSRAEGR